MSAHARNKSALPLLLASWHSWAETMPDLKDTAMCAWTWGPHTAGKQYDRAVVNGHKFSSKRISKRAKANNSIIMIRPEGNPPQFGEVQAFYEFVPPWAMSQPHGAALSIADVQWFENKGRNGELFDAPQVTRVFKDDPAGNLWRCENIIPTYVALVPHLSKDEWWQVIHVDVDFTTREY